MLFGQKIQKLFRKETKKTELPEKFAGKTEEELVEIHERAKQEMRKIAEDPEKDFQDLSDFLSENCDALDLCNYLKWERKGRIKGE